MHSCLGLCPICKNMLALTFRVTWSKRWRWPSGWRHKGKGAQRLYLVMWKGYPNTEASWETESHLHNVPLILEDYLSRVRATNNADAGPKETAKAVDGGPGSYDASRAFNNDVPTLVNEVFAGEIAFGTPNLQRDLCRLCIGLLTTKLI